MSDLLWPGDHRAGGLLGDEAFLDACLQVEAAWSCALVAGGLAPAGAAVGADRVRALVGADDLPVLAAQAESGGNPVVPLVRLLRERLDDRLDDPAAARWLHRGLTSQDVLDTALVLCARDALAAVRTDLLAQAGLLAALASRHRRTPMVARTITQHAVPTTFGLRASLWLGAVLDAWDEVAGLSLPVQLGGAGGTMAATVELARHLTDPVAAVAGGDGVTADAAARLGLAPAPPWHTVRTTVTRLGDASVRCTDAWGRIAADVLLGSRPEVGELSEGSPGASSTMPHKANPVLSVLVHRAALTAPGLAATLHLAAAGSAEERPAGAWHAEWATLRALLRRAVVAGSQTTDLLRDLQVHPDRMAATLAAARDGVRSEQTVMADLAGRAPAEDYLGAADAYVGAVLQRADQVLAPTGGGRR